MTAGVQVINALGIVQIDENAYNYHLVSKQIISMTQSNGLFKGTVNVGSYPDAIIAVVSNSPTLKSFNPDDNIWSIYRDVAGALECYIFAKATPVTSGMGVEIYNGAGALVFSTSRNPMRVIKADNGVLGGGGLENPSPSKKVAFFYTTGSIVLIRDGNMVVGSAPVGAFMKADNSGLQEGIVGSIPRESGNLNLVTYGDYRNAILIDVTGY